MKILILKPSSLGDVVQALPVLRLLKLHYPTSQIYWWIDASLTSLLKDDPDLAGIIRFERKRWKSPWNWPETVQSVLELRRLGFDLVIDLQGLARSGAFGWLANGRTFIGIEDPREGAFGFYDLRVSRPSYYTHAVDWYLEVLKTLHVPVHDRFLWMPENCYFKAIVHQKRVGDHRPLIIINPGARWINKRWPTEHFAGLVKGLAQDFPEHRFAILGSRADMEAANQIAQAAPTACLNLAGKTSLPEMVEWIRACDLMVTNDTGPMHVAAALKKPVVGLFGPTEQRRTGPYGQLQNVLRIPLPCAPCMKQTCTYIKPIECLRGISPEWVRTTVRRHLAR